MINMWCSLSADNRSAAKIRCSSSSSRVLKDRTVIRQLIDRLWRHFFSLFNFNDLEIFSGDDGGGQEFRVFLNWPEKKKKKKGKPVILLASATVFWPSVLDIHTHTRHRAEIQTALSDGVKRLVFRFSFLFFFFFISRLLKKWKEKKRRQATTDTHTHTFWPMPNFRFRTSSCSHPVLRC